MELDVDKCKCMSFFNSSVGKKQVLALTGLALCGFLVTHLAGNLLILCSAESFNTYAHKLITNPLLIPAEIVLASLFLSHIGLAIKLTVENKAARPVGYYVKTRSGRGATFASSTMPVTGMIVLVFMILHLIHFKFGPEYFATYNGIEMRDFHKLIMETFSKPGYVAWYVFAQICLGIHVSHGFSSAFQSLGINHPKYTPSLNCISKLYALAITVGFCLIPIWCYLKGGN
jgi:succinate dehydrogenase / fumarate reductase cytochrome b subunit